MTKAASDCAVQRETAGNEGGRSSLCPSEWVQKTYKELEKCYCTVLSKEEEGEEPVHLAWESKSNGKGWASCESSSLLATRGPNNSMSRRRAHSLVLSFSSLFASSSPIVTILTCLKHTQKEEPKAVLVAFSSLSAVGFFSSLFASFHLSSSLSRASSLSPFSSLPLGTTYEMV